MGRRGFAHGPADHPPAKDTQDTDQIKPALSGQHAGGIGRPDLVKLLHGKIAHTIRRDRSAVAALGRGYAIPGTLATEEALLAHEPSNAITPFRTTQCMSEPRTTVSLTTTSKLLADKRTQLGVLQLPFSGLLPPLFPVAVAAARDDQSFT